MAQHQQAVVVGTGPNGLAAAITIAKAGNPVTIFEANATVGGGARSAELTLPGFKHDVCSAVHPLGSGSPFFRTLPLRSYGLEWVHPDAPLAHPLDDGTAVMLERSLSETARGLGPDGRAYSSLMRPYVKRWEELSRMLLRPLLGVPRHPLVLARFGIPALLPARTLAAIFFRQQRTRALFAGMAAHSMLPLESPISASFGLVLAAMGHAAGWPFALGGSQKITDALVACLSEMGGEIVTQVRIESLDALPSAWATLLDITPQQLLQIASDRLPSGFVRQLRRYRYGPGVFKLDYALDAPVPWTARDCLRAGTVHIGGTLDEISAAEQAVSRGFAPERPFVLVTQPTLFDPTRAPLGKHTLWAYCHVPNGSAFDMTTRIEAQIERFAPGFRKRILARSSMPPASLEVHNANYVGGDINGGLQDIRQFITRPTRQVNPYRTPLRGLYFCSASTPPGGGVHGMCGHNAAVLALRSC